MGVFANIKHIGKYLRVNGADFSETAIGTGFLPAEDGRIWAVYTISDTSAPSTLLYADTGISGMEVDGVATPVAKTFQFSTTGKHLVKYKIVDGIAANQFANCTLLSELYLPEKAVKLGASSLLNCSGLTVLKLPKAVLSAGYAIMTGSSALTHFDFPVGMNEASLARMTSLDLGDDDLPPSMTKINLQGCTSMVHLTRLPDSITTIELCQNCKFPLSKLPDSLAGTIPANCFAGCTNVTFTEIPAGVTQINAAAFAQVTTFPYLHILKTDAVVTLANKSAFGGTYDIYVGDGQSEAADNALLAQYTSDSVWGQISSRLKTWYSYLNS